MTSDPFDLAGKAIEAARDVVAEPAKATQETAKVASKALDLVRDAGRVFGPAADELAVMMGDQMRYWRFLNATRLSEKVDTLRARRNISPDDIRALSFGESVKILEAASMEDNDIVQDLWAQLLVNATNKHTAVDIEKIYIDILKSLSAPEVLFLNLLWECHVRNSFKSIEDIKNFNKEMNKLAEEGWRTLPTETREVATQNLVRLRCVTFRPNPINISGLIKQMYLDERRQIKINNISPDVMDKLIKGIFDMIEVSSGIKSHKAAGHIALTRGFGLFPNSVPQIEVAEMNYLLTPIGIDLMRACALKDAH